MSEQDICERLMDDHGWPCVYGEKCDKCEAAAEIATLRERVRVLEDGLRDIEYEVVSGPEDADEVCETVRVMARRARLHTTLEGAGGEVRADAPSEAVEGV